MRIELEIPENSRIVSEIGGFTMYENEIMLEMGSYFVKSLKDRCESSEMKEYKRECKEMIEVQYREMYKDQLYELSITNKVAKEIYDGMVIEQTQREVQRMKELQEEKYRHMESLNQQRILEMSHKMDILEKQFRESEKENIVLKEKEKNSVSIIEMSVQQQISEHVQKKDEQISVLEKTIRDLKIEEERKIHKITVENSEIMTKSLIELNEKMECKKINNVEEIWENHICKISEQFRQNTKTDKTQTNVQARCFLRRSSVCWKKKRRGEES
jgi:hypothetical protein